MKTSELLGINLTANNLRLVEYLATSVKALPGSYLTVSNRQPHLYPKICNYRYDLEYVGTISLCCSILYYEYTIDRLTEKCLYVFCDNKHIERIRAVDVYLKVKGRYFSEAGRPSIKIVTMQESVGPGTVEKNILFHCCIFVYKLELTGVRRWKNRVCFPVASQLIN